MNYKRKEVIGDQTLYLGDCMEVMQGLDKVDAVVTDPPYGINMGGGFSGKGIAGNRRQYNRSDWDLSRPDSEVFEDILGASDTQIIWGGNYFTDLLPVSGKWLFWDKCQTMPTYSDGELAWTTISGDAVKQFTYNGCGMLAKEKNRVHPTQKPVALMQWCLGFLPNAKTILDPFMGSGTTLVACVKEQRKGIGIELDPDYFDIACKRVEEAYRQPTLFAEPETTKPEQTGLDL